MKNTVFILLLFCTIHQLNAQKIEKYYDYKWNECEPNAARFYSLATKTDSGYCRKDYYIREKRLYVIGNYLDSSFKVPNGVFTFYYPNGIQKSSGKYIKSKKEGLWLSFHNNGFMSDSTVYSNGNQIGISKSWYPTGYTSDSITLQEDRSGVLVSWFDNGIPSAAGRYSAGMKQTGKWKYFHKNGNISSIELYNESKLVDKLYFNQNGEMVKDTTSTDRQAQFKGGIQVWLKYISNHIYFPEGYKIVNADAVKVVVTFDVNENGDIENVFTSVPFEKAFDKIAEYVIKNAPKWLPAIKHNRCVRQTMHQPINFQNYKEEYN